MNKYFVFFELKFSFSIFILQKKNSETKISYSSLHFFFLFLATISRSSNSKFIKEDLCISIASTGLRFPLSLFNLGVAIVADRNGFRCEVREEGFIAETFVAERIRTIRASGLNLKIPLILTTCKKNLSNQIKTGVNWYFF